MDKETFEKIAYKINESTGYKTVFKDLQLVSYDERTHHAIIQANDFINMDYIKRNYTHEIIEAFDSVLGVETTVSCVYKKTERRKPHERFIM